MQRQSLLEKKLTFLQEMADKSKASSVENTASQADFKKLVAERDQYKLKMPMLAKRAGRSSGTSTPTDSLSRPDDLAALRRRNVFLADAVRKTRSRAHELTKARNVQKLASLPKLPKVVRSKAETKHHTALVEQLRKIQSVRVNPFMVKHRRRYAARRHHRREAKAFGSARASFTNAFVRARLAGVRIDFCCRGWIKYVTHDMHLQKCALIHINFW